MQLTLPVRSLAKSALNPIAQYMGNLVNLSVVLSAATLLSCQTHIPLRVEAGTFLNPPKVGEPIVANVGSVVCFNELDAIGMVRTGFFTSSCETLTEDMNLIAEAVVTQDAGEGPVLMVRTTLRDKAAWVPIPWHDWV